MQAEAANLHPDTKQARVEAANPCRDEEKMQAEAPNLHQDKKQAEVPAANPCRDEDAQVI
jgi:hypothetical protein